MCFLIWPVPISVTFCPQTLALALLFFSFLLLSPFSSCFALDICPCPCPLFCPEIQGQTLGAKHEGNGGKGKKRAKS